MLSELLSLGLKDVQVSNARSVREVYLQKVYTTCKRCPTKPPAPQAPRSASPPRPLQSSCEPLRAERAVTNNSHSAHLHRPTIAQTEAAPNQRALSNLTPTPPPTTPTAHLPPHPHNMHIKYISDAYAPCIRPAYRFPTKPPAPQSALPPRSPQSSCGPRTALPKAPTILNRLPEPP